MRCLVCAIFGHIPFRDMRFYPDEGKFKRCNRCGRNVHFVNDKGWVKRK